ncbi:MAG: cadherin-like domain-containing protein, partial [Epsilonproteobacteria bacterium]|nr:cadherin-like domain-containing protein [Campylobacterota bacterium]
LTYQVQAIDDSGAANNTSNIQDITITITGTNDLPTATANTNSIGNENAGSVGGNMITDDNGAGVDSDADISDTLTVTNVTGGDNYGTLTWNSDGSYSYDVDNTNPAVTGLTGTDTLTEVYTYTVSDGHGGTNTATLTITITDDNDAPVAVNDVNAITEDVASVNGDVTPGTVGQDYDPKPIGDTFTVTGAEAGVQTSTSGNINTTITGTYGTLVIQSDGTYVYTLDNTNPLVQGLSAGETLTDTFSYTISDTFGAHDTAQLDITINGANDGVTVVVNDVNVGSGDITVEERALPNGTQSDLTTETTSGTFVVTAPDGLDHITIGATDVTLAQLEGATPGTPVDVVVTNGTMSITGYDSTTGTVSYIYTLSTPYTTTPSGDDGATTEIASITISATDDD